MKTLGVDCANVIIFPLRGSVPGSVESLRAIVRSQAFENIYIVSRANILTQSFYLFRLERLEFWKITGIPKGNIYFCWRNKTKAKICQKLGIDYFVDDRLPVLDEMKNVEHRFVFNPTEDEVEKFPATLRQATRVGSWAELTVALLAL